jgi:hypothetical protein
MLRVMAAAIAALIAGMVDGMAAAPAVKVTCTNPANGWQWRIQINYVRATVDSFAARISNREISWHDANDRGNYTLDRNSGDLSAAFASSTGGYIMQYRCSLQAAH